MRSLFACGIAVVACLLLVSCSKDPDGLEVDSDGLTAEIRASIPDTILAGLRELGQPIYGGANPPDITGTYLLDPAVGQATSIVGDTVSVGHTFDPLTYTFERQNDLLEISANFSAGNSSEEHAFRGYVVGEGCNFTAFMIYRRPSNSPGVEWVSLHSISGCVMDAGIEDASYAGVQMEDPEGIFALWRQNGQGRRMADEDGLAERQ